MEVITVIKITALEAYWNDKSWRALLLLIMAAVATLLMLKVMGKHVHLTVYGQERTVYTFKDNAKDVLDEQNIAQQPEDLVRPALQAPIKDGQQVTVIKVEKKDLVVEQEISFETIRQGDDQLDKGVEKVKQCGVNGLKHSVYQRVLHDGVEISKKLVKTEVVKKPQPQIIAVGRRAPVSVASRSMDVPRVGNGSSYTVVTTAYTYTGCNTASGVAPYRGVVAVDPQVFPMGTRLYIEGYGPAVALDRGSGVKGMHVDLFFPTRAEALNWGRRTVKVHMVE